MGMLFVYLCMSFLWGLYAAVQQLIAYRDTSEIRLRVVFLVNFLLSPICMIVAIYKDLKKLNKKRK